MIPTNIIIFIVLMYVLLSVFLTFRLLGKSVVAIIVKGLTSLAFITVDVLAYSYSGISTTMFILFLAGGIFGLCGDILLDIKHFYPKVDAIMLNLGFLSFGLGHLCYMAGLIVYGQIISVGSLLWPLIGGAIFAVICVIADILGTKLLKLRSEGFQIQANIYLFVLAMVTGFSVGLAIMNSHFILMAVGMVLFLLSDIILCFIYFAADQKNNKIAISINHILYYTAQLLIALMLLGL